MNEFVPGMLAAGYLVIGLFFIRFWRTSRDRLFLIFALSFLLLAANRTMLSLTGVFDAPRGSGVGSPDEVATPYYWIRLAAYLLILVAIVDKNLRSARS